MLKGESGKIGKTRYEQETIINYNAEEESASVWTANPVTIRKLDSLVKEHPENYKLVSDSGNEKEYQFPKKLITFRSGIKHEMSEEQRKASGERLAKMREKKKETARKGGAK